MILIADSALTGEKAKGIDMGAVDFISKPFDPVELVAWVGSALRTRRSSTPSWSKRAYLDGLTGFGNRFALRDRFPYEWSRAAAGIIRCRCSSPTSIISRRSTTSSAIPRATRCFARPRGRCAGRAREGDFVARYGGEEFVVVALNCATSTGRSNWPNDSAARSPTSRSASGSQPIQVTCSVGVALVSDRTGPEVGEVLDQADQALFHCKDAGRNAVWIWDPGRGKAIPAGRPTPRNSGGNHRGPGSLNDVGCCCFFLILALTHSA